MARGWESKSVESQIESAEKIQRPQRPLTHEQRAAAQERQRLELSRAYLAGQIAVSTKQGYIDGLQRALKEIEEKLARLQDA